MLATDTLRPPVDLVLREGTVLPSAEAEEPTAPALHVLWMTLGFMAVTVAVLLLA